MLIFPLGTFTVSGLTDTEIPLTGDFTVAMSMRFPTICTSFDHDASDESFDGSMILTGFHHYQFVSGSFITTYSDTDEGDVTFSLTVALGEYDTAASTGEAELVGTWSEFPLDDWSISTIVASLEVELTLVGTTRVVGVIDGSIELEPIGTTVGMPSREISLTVGAACF
jgi:hypothetical protein